MTGLVIIGAGSHGIDVATIAAAAGFPVVGFLDDFKTDTDILGKSCDVILFDRYLLGVNDSATRERLDTPNRVAARAVHPSASVHHTLSMGDGVVVGANATIGAQVTLGRHTHLNGNVFICRAKVGNYVTISPSATVCGDVLIGDGVMIGANATVSNLCTIGPGAVIGAGAVLPPGTHVPAGETWVGVPARAL